MNKAILVIDKPSSCIECPYSLLGGSYCTLTQEDLIVKDGDISENCPLKPLEENYISIDWLKHNIPFQSMSVRIALLSMLDSWESEKGKND